MTTNQIGVYIPVSVVYPEVRSDFTTFKRLLGGLSRTDSLFWCARLNAVLSSREASCLEKQDFALNRFLTKSEINAVNNFAKSYGGAENVLVFFRGQLLELIRWIVLYCNDQSSDGITFEDTLVRTRFAQAALIAGDLWAKRVFGSRFTLKDGLDIGRRRALGAIRKSIEDTSLSPYIQQSLGRGWTIFHDYFQCSYPNFENEFNSATGLSVEQYYICLASMIVNFMDPKKNEGIFNTKTLGEFTPYHTIFQKYVNLESQTDSELRNSLWGARVAEACKGEIDAPYYDYRPLREKPIFRAEDGRAIILDPIMFSERVSVGPLFYLLQNKASKPNDIFSAFGIAYENYANDILRHMFSESQNTLLSTRLQCNIEGKDRTGKTFEIDSCLNNVNEIVLFEMKAGWLSEETILSDDYESYLHCLLKKYGTAKGDSRDRDVKGMGQLARTINLIASKEWSGHNDEFSEVERIYPVLVVHDVRLSAPIYGNYFAKEFENYLSPDAILPSGELMKGKLRVTPLIILTIEDLENLETSVEHFSLCDLFRDYTLTAPHRLESLHNFIALSKYSGKMYHSRTLPAKCVDILDRAQKAIYPDSIG